MTYRAYTDGASRGNPGEAGIGIFVTDEEGTCVLSLHGFIGICTNNVAEYTALVTLLEHVTQDSFPAAGSDTTRLAIHADSELMVRQVTGAYRVRDKGLKPYHARVRRLLADLPFPYSILHIPREENREADRLANLGIDERKPIGP